MLSTGIIEINMKIIFKVRHHPVIVKQQRIYTKYWGVKFRARLLCFFSIRSSASNLILLTVRGSFAAVLWHCKDILWPRRRKEVQNSYLNVLNVVFVLTLNCISLLRTKSSFDAVWRKGIICLQKWPERSSVKKSHKFCDSQNEILVWESTDPDGFRIQSRSIHNCVAWKN